MGRLLKDYTGMICGTWEVIERDYNPVSKSHETFWKTKCLKCGTISSVRKTDLDKKPRSCNNCKGEIIQQAMADRGLITHPVHVGDVFGKLTVISRPSARKDRSGKRSYCNCLCECGNRVSVRTDHLVGSHHSRTISCGCAQKSAGEIKIANLLDEYSIKYKEQYKINDFSKYALFDFAIFDITDNLLGLIEYDGEQHFQAIDYFGGEEKFAIQRQRDENKNRYCKEHEIKLLRIPYYDYDKINLQYLIKEFPEIERYFEI